MLIKFNYLLTGIILLSLSSLAFAEESLYRLEEPGVATWHNRVNNGQITTTANVWAQLGYANGAAVSDTEVESFSAIPPTGNCQYVSNSHVYQTETLAYDSLDASTSRYVYGPSELDCELSETPHQSGNYTLNAIFKDGSIITIPYSVPSTGITATELPPVDNLQYTINSENGTITIGWEQYTRQIAYDLEIRVSAYHGKYSRKQVRIKNLPIDSTSFTLSSDMVAFLDLIFADRAEIQIRISDNDTNTRSSHTVDLEQTYAQLLKIDPFISTSYKTNHGILGDSFTTSDKAFAEIEGLRTISGKPVVYDIIQSLSVQTGDAVICTSNESGEVGTWQSYQLRLQDSDRDGFINADEFNASTTNYYRNINTYCTFTSPHAAGDYTFNLTLHDGSVITKTISTEAGVEKSELSPVENLEAIWDSTTREMAISWSLPVTYNPNDEIQIRIYTYRYGVRAPAELRITKLPSNLTNFYLTKAITSVFDTPFTNEVQVQVRVYRWGNDPNSFSIAKTTRNYPFISSMDVNGDAKVGIAEIINTLKVLSGQ